jgi:hypothetical protein
MGKGAGLDDPRRVDLVNKKKTERIESPIYKKFGNALEIIKKIEDKGGRFGVCPPYAGYFGATGGDKSDWVELARGVTGT